MKKNYLVIALLFLATAFGLKGNSQTVLTPGDIMIVGIDNAGTDRIAFYTFVELQPNTKFSFTTIGWAGSSFRPTASSDETRTWDSGSTTYPAGTVFWYDGVSGGGGNITTVVGGANTAAGSITTNFGTSTFAIGASDVIYVWQNNGAFAMPSTTDNSPGTWGTWVSSVITGTSASTAYKTGSISNANGQLPDGLTIDVNAFALGLSSIKGGVYSGAFTTSSAIANSSAWNLTSVSGDVNAFNFWRYDETAGAAGSIGSPTLGTNDTELEAAISVSPNPASTIVNIKIANSAKFNNAVLSTITGKTLKRFSTTSIDLSSFSSGMYFLNISTDRGTVVKRIVRK